MNSEDLEAKVGKDDIVYRLVKRAEIRRQIPDRKSVQEGKADRIADLLEEAASVIDQLRKADKFIELLEELDKIIEAYHGRDGTFNFHYSHFDIMSWRVWMKEYGLSQADWDRMEIEDYAVRISYTDNSNSYDDYCVLLKDILEWHKQRSTGV